MVRTAASGPENRASTEPSRQLRTQPESDSLDASLTVQARYATPWTRPVILTLTVVIGWLTLGPMKGWHVRRRHPNYLNDIVGGAQ
jgi:hypothetical protein